MDSEPQDQLADLIAAAAAGDVGAWDALVERYTPLVMAVVRGFRLHEHDVSDVVQTVWLRLLEHLGRLREPRALPGWLITTTRNETLRLLKGQNRTRPVADIGLETTPGPEHWTTAQADASLDADLLRVERREAVLQAFATLSDRDRTLLRLLSADPVVPYAQISAQMGIAVGSIGPTRARILDKVRAHPAVHALVRLDDQRPDTGSRHTAGPTRTSTRSTPSPTSPAARDDRRWR